MEIVVVAAFAVLGAEVSDTCYSSVPKPEFELPK